MPNAGRRKGGKVRKNWSFFEPSLHVKGEFHAHWKVKGVAILLAGSQKSRPVCKSHIDGPKYGVFLLSEFLLFGRRHSGITAELIIHIVASDALSESSEQTDVPRMPQKKNCVLKTEAMSDGADQAAAHGPHQLFQSLGAVVLEEPSGKNVGVQIQFSLD